MAVPARWNSPALRRLSGCNVLGCGSSPTLVGGAMRWVMGVPGACRGAMRWVMGFPGVCRGVVGVALRVFRWKCDGIGTADSPALVGARCAVGILGVRRSAAVPADGWRSWPLDGGVRGHCGFRKIKTAGGKAAVRGRGETGSLFGFKAQGGEEFFHHSDEFVRAEVLRFGRGIVVQVNDDAAVADGHIGVEHLQILNFLHVGFR